MSSNYFSKNYAADEKAAARKKARRILGLPVPMFAAAAVAVVGGGAAFAAMMVSSNEANAKVEAGVAAELKLSDAKASGPLYPGMGVDVSFDVENPNPFPVTLTSIVAGSGAPSISCTAPADIAKLSSSLLISGSTVTLAAPVEIAANGTKTVEIKDAVKLSKTATGGCSLAGKFKVTGSGAGSGN